MLPCEVRGKDYNPFSNPIIWYKSTGNTESSIQLNTNAAISDAVYYKTGRYHVDANMTLTGEPWVRLNLVITGKEGEGATIGNLPI